MSPAPCRTAAGAGPSKSEGLLPRRVAVRRTTEIAVVIAARTIIGPPHERGAAAKVAAEGAIEPLLCRLWAAPSGGTKGDGGG